jgi:WD40 repeat protein
VDQPSSKSVEQIFLEVVDLPREARAQALAELCGGDERLLRHVQRLIDADETAQAGLEASQPGFEVYVPASAEPMPLRVGNYVVSAVVGEGGIGTVYDALHEPTGRRAAVKLIRAGLATSRQRERFRIEAETLGRLNDPGIAQLYDAGLAEVVWPEGAQGRRPFIAMEFVEKAMSCVEFARKQNLTARDCVKLIEQVACGVQHAHQRGVIHRDLKPSNVLVSPDGRPKVVDFGIARLLDAAAAADGITTTGQIVGTVRYMSPEQAGGDPQQVDTRADIYSLGAILYEMLAGRPLIEPKSSSTLGAAMEVLNATPAPLASIRPECGGELDWIVMKCLEKDRTGRYETANGLAMDLRRYLNGEAVHAAPPSTAYRVRKFVKRHRYGVAAGAAVAAALLIGLAAFAWQAKVARRAADTAERAAYQAQMISAAGALEDLRMDAASALLAGTTPRLRGWEYRHLASCLDRSLPSPFPADWHVTRLSVAGASGTVAIEKSNEQGSADWVVLDPDLRTERFVLRDTAGGFVALAPDGTRALWTPWQIGDRRPARLWSLDTKSVLATIPVRPIQSVRDYLVASWSPTGDRFAISRYNQFELRDGHTGSLVRQKEVKGYATYTGDSRWILLNNTQQAADDASRTCRLLDAQTLEPQLTALHFESPINSRDISCWQSRLACAAEDGTLCLMEIVDGALRERSRIPADIGVIVPSTWSRDGRLVAVGSLQGRVRVWEAASGTLRGDFTRTQLGVNGMLFLPDSGNLLTCDSGGHHQVWPISSGAAGVLAAHRSFVYPVVMSKDGAMLLTGGWDGFVGQSSGLKLWDARTGAPVAEYGLPGEIFGSADLSPDGRYAVACIWSETDSLCRTDVIDLQTGAVAATVANEGRQQACAIVFPDGHRVISRYPEGETCVWDLATGKILWKTIPHAPGDYRAAAVSPDGHLLALADGSFGIRMLNADSYADIRRWNAHSEQICSLSFSPDGKWLLSTSTDDTIGVWDVATGRLVARLTGHNADVFCAVMSPDGTRIASGGRDGYVRLWDTIRFQNVAQLGGHKDYIYSLAWSPDGRQLFSGSGDWTVRIWDTRTLAEQLDALKARAEELPRLEATVAHARANALDPVAAATALSSRERELVRQIIARFAQRGTPGYYCAPRATSPIVIDGKIDESAWSAAPWSSPFVDIEGDAKPKPRFTTQMKILWDDECLYIAAGLEDPHVWATKTKPDEIVFQDNDFEVFVDPAGHGRWYDEVEVNALGTIFDLRLDRPYSERGTPHHEWSPPGLKAAVAIDGTLNDPSDVDRGWTVEIAIPHAALAEHAEMPLPPRVGDIWRINFSRVQWQHDIRDGKYVKRENTREDNWTWTPQHVINMHVPREWGFVEFGGNRP